MIYEVAVRGRDGSETIFKVEGKDGAWWINGRRLEIDAEAPACGILSVIAHGRSYEARRSQLGAETVVEVEGSRFVVEVRDPRSLKGRRDARAGAEGPKKIIAPMPGKVLRILAPEGSDVEAGAGIIVIEAMKMQNELKAPKGGTITKMNVIEGSTVNPGETLAVVS